MRFTRIENAVSCAAIALDIVGKKRNQAGLTRKPATDVEGTAAESICGNTNTK